MKKRILAVSAFFALGCLLFAGGSKEMSSQGKMPKDNVSSYEVPKSVPERTVADTLAVLAMLDYLGVDVVGIPNTSYKLDPKFDKKAKIGLPMTPDMEKLKFTKPNLFITVSSIQAAIEPQVKTAKIPTVFLKTDNHGDFLEAMEYLGKVYRKEERAKKYIQSVTDRIEKVKNKASKNKKPKVLILFGTPGGMNFATDYSFTGGLAKVLGAENVWTDAKIKTSYMPINLELIKEANPDIIIRFSHVNPADSVKMFKKEFENSFWSSLPAVKNGKVYDLDNKHFSVAGNIHIPEALDILAEIFYGK